MGAQAHVQGPQKQPPQGRGSPHPTSCRCSEICHSTVALPSCQENVPPQEALLLWTPISTAGSVSTSTPLPTPGLDIGPRSVGRGQIQRHTDTQTHVLQPLSFPVRGSWGGLIRPRALGSPEPLQTREPGRPRAARLPVWGPRPGNSRSRETNTH